jgi:hypothetical protein
MRTQDPMRATTFLTLAAFTLLSSDANAAAVEWFFSPVGGDDYHVGVTIYGNDNRGLAAYNIEVIGLDALGIDPNTISWTESVDLSNPPLSESVGPSFAVANSQAEAEAPVFDLGKNFSFNGLFIGVLNMPGALESSLAPSNFAGTTATLFTLEAPELPATDLAARTVPRNGVSTASRGGNWIVDYAMRAVPQGGTIDFGEVPLGTTILEDIVALINHGFDGPMLDVTGFGITGPDAALFDVPGFSPSTLQSSLQSDEHSKTYDLSFAPTQLGSFAAKLTFNYESTFWPDNPDNIVEYSLIGTAVTEPISSDLTNNGFVDFQDLTILLANWNKEVTAAEGNLVNADTTPVNFQDLTVLLADWTGPGPAGSPEAALGEAVPEPSTLVLLAMATLGLSFGWRRRRRA